MFFTCRCCNETVFTINKLVDEQLYNYGNKNLVPIAKRLFKEYHIDPPLDPYLVLQIFNNCQFWLLFYNRTDAWCSLLSPEELLLSRYWFDMWEYDRFSYGH